MEFLNIFVNVWVTFYWVIYICGNAWHFYLWNNLIQIYVVFWFLCLLNNVKWFCKQNNCAFEEKNHVSDSVLLSFWCNISMLYIKWVVKQYFVVWQYVFIFLKLCHCHFIKSDFFDIHFDLIFLLFEVIMRIVVIVMVKTQKFVIEVVLCPCMILLVSYFDNIILNM